jgi:uncharacterized cofD-like protein
VNRLRVVNFRGGGTRALTEGLQYVQRNATLLGFSSKLLRAVTNMQRTSIVTVADSGGSTGKFRTELDWCRGNIGDQSRAVVDEFRPKYPLTADAFMHRFKADIPLGQRPVREIFLLAIEEKLNELGQDLRHDLSEELNRFLGDEWIDRTRTKKKHQFLRSVLMHRFPSNESLHGHSLKNILLLAFEDIARIEGHGLSQAAEEFNRFCNTLPHRVMPVSSQGATLCIRRNDRSVLRGEGAIDTFWKNPEVSYQEQIKELFLEPKIRASTDVCNAILNADILIVPFGDLRTTIKPMFLVDGVIEAWRASPALKVFFINLGTKELETPYWQAGDFVEDFQLMIGPDAGSEDFGRLTVVYSTTKLPASVFSPGVRVTRGDLHSRFMNLEVLERDLAAPNGRHDPIKVAQVLTEIIIRTELVMKQRLPEIKTLPCPYIVKARGAS